MIDVEAEFNKELVDMIHTYRTLMHTLLNTREKVILFWTKSNLIKPNIVSSAYNPTTNFIGIGFKCDQA